MENAVAWGAVRAVGLDLMDTVLRDPFREALEEVTGLPLDRLQALRDPAAFRAFELGEIDESEYGRRFFRPETGRTMEMDVLWRALERRYAWIDGMETLLARLAARLPVHLVSNYSPWYDRVCTRFRLDRYVTAHHPSFRIGARKPDAAYYERVLERAGLAPEALLFVDDREPNVEAARAAGLPGIVFRGTDDLARSLVPLLDRDAPPPGGR